MHPLGPTLDSPGVETACSLPRALQVGSYLRKLHNRCQRLKFEDLVSSHPYPNSSAPGSGGPKQVLKQHLLSAYHRLAIVPGRKENNRKCTAFIGLVF